MEKKERVLAFRKTSEMSHETLQTIVGGQKTNSEFGTCNHWTTKVTAGSPPHADVGIDAVWD